MIAARNIHKRYGRTRVLRGVDLAADAGQIVAIVGENGCGKSTLLRVLAGAEAMEVGQIVRPASLGYCPQDSVLYPYLTPDEHFELFGCGYGLSAAVVRARRDALCERFAFGQYRRRIVAHLSGGTKQKLNFALAVLHQPPLLLLDEPYASLDTRAYGRLLAFLDEERRSGKCILIVAHLLHDQQRFDRILTLDDGRLHAATD